MYDYELIKNIYHHIVNSLGYKSNDCIILNIERMIQEKHPNIFMSDNKIREDSQLGPETASANQRRINSGFYVRYMSGYGLDIGYRGAKKDVLTVLETAKGVELGDKGYDGINLPHPTESQDYVYSSHMLEHVGTNNVDKTIQEWFRVLKKGGYLIVSVPSADRYEKKTATPSRFNCDHKRFYQPHTLLNEVYTALGSLSYPFYPYEVKHLMDCSAGFDRTIPPEKHSCGEYQIELVIQKL